MKRTLATIVLAAFAVTLSAEDIVFKDDVKQYVADGDKTKDVSATLTIGTDSVTITRKGNDATVISFASITGATYDRRARQRKLLGLPMTGQSMAGAAQKLQHFLTIKYKTDTAGDFVELELGKDIANRVVSTLEAKSGTTVQKVIGG